MSDWLLQGVDPRDPTGKEIFFHTAEEWFDFALEDGIAAKFLKSNRDFSGPDSLTLDNLRRFSSFLKSCGGFMADVSYG